MSTNSSIWRVLNKILVSLTSNLTLLIRPKPLKKGFLNTRLGSSGEQDQQGYIQSQVIYNLTVT